MKLSWSHRTRGRLYHEGKMVTKEERQREQNALEGHKNNARKCYLGPI